MSEDINHMSLLNVGESVNGVGRTGSRSQIRPSPSHYSDDHVGSSYFCSYGNNGSGNRSHYRRSP